MKNPNDMLECELYHLIKELNPKLNEVQKLYLNLRDQYAILTRCLERNYNIPLWFAIEEERKDNLIAEYHLLHKEIKDV